MGTKQFMADMRTVQGIADTGTVHSVKVMVDTGTMQGNGRH